MRTLLLLSTIFALLPVSWMYPQIGVLVWGWISYMSPHQLVWGGAGAFRLNLIVAIITILGWIFSSHTKKIPVNATTILLFLFVVMTSLSTYFSLVPEASFRLWNRYMKFFILLFMILILMNNRIRIHSMVWIIVVSIGYYGVSGGLIGIISGGNNNFVGPPSSQIADNNHVALAMVVTIPLINYLRMNSELKFVRMTLLAAMLLTVIATLSTYSRGGFIGLVAMLIFLWYRSKHKAIPLVIAVIALIPAVLLMPQKWWDRMDTIEVASEKDGSFQARLSSWEMNFNMAVAHPVLGGGLVATENARVYQRFRPAGDSGLGRAAHSIYFQILGEQGFVGLTIYLLFLYTGWRNSAVVIRIVKNNNALTWAGDLARMSQVSFVGYAVAGAALSMAYYDVLLTIVVLQSSLRTLVQSQVPQVARYSPGPAIPIGQSPRTNPQQR